MSTPVGEQVFLTAHRPMTALEVDPAPGSVTGVRALVDRLRDVADELSAVRGHLSNPARAMWSGPTADLVGSSLEDLTARAQALTASVDEAAAMLSTWADRLEELQDRADALDREALAARDARLDAEQSLAVAAYRSGPVLPPDPAHRRAVADAEADLDAVRAQARALGHEYDRAALAHAARLDDAALPLAAWFVRGPASAWDLASDAHEIVVRPVAHHLDALSDVTSAAAGVADLAAVVSAALGSLPTALVAETVSVALSLSTTRDRLLLASGAGGSWTEAGVEAASVVGGLGTRVTGKAITTAARSDVAAVDHFTVKEAAMSMVEDPGDGARWVVEHSDPDGGAPPVPLQAHAVDDPWETGPGFAGAAVVRATVPRPTGSAPTPAGARPQESSSAAPTRPQARD